MDVRATAKIRIEPRQEIMKTLELYKQGLQYCVDIAWGMRIRNNVQLHPFVYTKLRETLPSQIAIGCIKQACGIVKKAKSNPIINKVSIRYNFPRSASFKDNILSISTIEGRVKVPFEVPDCYKEYFSWGVRESLLIIDKIGRCFFLFTFQSSIETNTRSNIQKRVLGVDAGIFNLATTSERRFYGGKHIRHLRKKRDKLVSELQSKCTKSARRKLRKISGRWKRFMAKTNHEISKSIVSNLNNGDVIVMENLTNIRKAAKYNKWIHKWAFRQLQDDYNISRYRYDKIRKSVIDKFKLSWR